MSRVRSAGRAGARATTSVAGWTGDRVGDLATWAVHLIRDLPVRVGRLALTLWAAVPGLFSLVPGVVWAWRTDRWSGLRSWAVSAAQSTGGWLVTLITRLLDLVGLPELIDFFWRTVSHMSPLTGAEIAAASRVLGPGAVRWGDVRVAQGGLIGFWFKKRGDRAFDTFYTVNLPHSGPNARQNLDILIHELVHVYQYERVGSIYSLESLYAQHAAGYDYGGVEGLRRAAAAGKRFWSFNREQQAQLVQDYYLLLQQGADAREYEPFIADMRAGKFNA